ncbi:MAG: hypothetical protein KF812_01620, partial [Fimbriimonadaceae bacterium]|nr:hypothetical protein [Fimbriimonadaceae bacterium]
TGGLTTGGTTGGTTTGGTTGTTTTGGTAGSEFCYFVTQRTPSSGRATPLNRVEQLQPADGDTVAVPRSFQFRSVRGANPVIQLEYVIQISDVNTFPRGRTQIVWTDVDRQTPANATISTSPINLANVFPGSARLYWRVGVKAQGDFPGPVEDPSGVRYLFSGVRLINRPLIP